MEKIEPCRSILSVLPLGVASPIIHVARIVDKAEHILLNMYKGMDLRACAASGEVKNGIFYLSLAASRIREQFWKQR